MRTRPHATTEKTPDPSGTSPPSKRRVPVEVAGTAYRDAQLKESERVADAPDAVVRCQSPEGATDEKTVPAVSGPA
jgi:hypothetical protein